MRRLVLRLLWTTALAGTSAIGLAAQSGPSFQGRFSGMTFLPPDAPLASSMASRGQVSQAVQALDAATAEKLRAAGAPRVAVDCQMVREARPDVDPAIRKPAADLGKPPASGRVVTVPGCGTTSASRGGR
jgi:hypothetical protein